MHEIKDITFPFNIKKNDEPFKETSIEDQQLIARISQEEQIVSINGQPIKESEVIDHLEKKGYNRFFIFKINRKAGVDSKTTPWTEVEASDPLLLVKKLIITMEEINLNNTQNLLQNSYFFLVKVKTVAFLLEEDKRRNSLNAKTSHRKLSDFFTDLEKEMNCTEDIKKTKAILQSNNLYSKEDKEEKTPMVLYNLLLKKLDSIDQKTNPEEKKKVLPIEQTLDTLWEKSFKR